MPFNNDRTEYALTRNPIILRESFNQATFNKAGGSFHLYMNETEVFNGRFQISGQGEMEVDVADIVDASTPLIAEPVPTGEPIVVIECGTDMFARELLAVSNYGSYEKQSTVTVFPGGIPRSHLRKYLKESTNPFESRFCNYNSNFLLSTRCSSWRITMPESEVHPIPFIVSDSLNLPLSVSDPVSGSEITAATVNGLAVAAWDIDASRRRFFDYNDIIPSILDLRVAGRPAVRVVIERQEAALERYRFKFRNSLGVFEIISIDSPATLITTPGDDDDERGLYSTFDTDVFDFVAGRLRMPLSMAIELSAILPAGPRRSFMLDMLASDEVYLLDLFSDPVKVIPSVEKVSRAICAGGPEQVKLTFTFADTEQNIIDEISGVDQAKWPRVFSQHFSKQFN